MEITFRKLQGLVYFSAILLSFAITSCAKDDDEATDNESLVAEDLMGTWHPTYVSLDNNDVTGNFANFSISIDKDLNYTTNGADLNRQPNPWPAAGSFTLRQPVDDPSMVSLIRNDGLEVTVILSSDSIARFNFFFDADNQRSNGRTKSVEGEWVFVF